MSNLLNGLYEDRANPHRGDLDNRRRHPRQNLFPPLVNIPSMREASSTTDKRRLIQAAGYFRDILIGLWPRNAQERASVFAGSVTIAAVVAAGMAVNAAERQDSAARTPNPIEVIQQHDGFARADWAIATICGAGALASTGVLCIELVAARDKNEDERLVRRQVQQLVAGEPPDPSQSRYFIMSQSGTRNQ